MSLEEAQSRKEALQAERLGTHGTTAERVKERAAAAEQSRTRGMTLPERIKHYTLETLGRGPEWQYKQAVAEMYRTVEDARTVAANSQDLLKEYIGLQKELQHRLRVDQQILSCNIAQISHYERIASDTETKLLSAEAASMYGITTTEALALHSELSAAQEKLIELNSESNMVTMQILTADDELANLTNTVTGIQQQTATFNQQRIALEAYSRQADAQSRLVKGLRGFSAMREVYEQCAIVQEAVSELQAQMRNPAFEPLPLQDRIRSPQPPKRSVGNKQYWQENMVRALPYLRSASKKE